MELELNVYGYASSVGKALAVILRASNVDGYDIEFALASEAETKPLNAMPRQTQTPSRAVRLWVLDFNLCSQWEDKVGWEQPEALIAQLVVAFFDNDPYYPLPLTETAIEQQLWSVFMIAHLVKAKEALAAKESRLCQLPNRPTIAFIDRGREKMRDGLGHGHRDLRFKVFLCISPTMG